LRDNDSLFSEFGRNPKAENFISDSSFYWLWGRAFGFIHAPKAWDIAAIPYASSSVPKKIIFYKRVLLNNFLQSKSVYNLSAILFL
jgi:hypothetical protein